MIFLRSQRRCFSSWSLLRKPSLLFQESLIINIGSAINSVVQLESMQKQETESNVLILRHGRSLFNEGEMEFFNKYPQLSYPAADDHPAYGKEVLYNPKFIDTQLSSKGIEQCNKAKKRLKDKQLSIVLVSPLKRALQTAQIVFGDRNIPIIVIPILTESFKYSCDVSSDILPKMKEFPNFDWSHFKGLGDHWEVRSILPLDVVQKFEKEKVKHGNKSFEEMNQVLCSLIQKRQVFEDYHQLRNRVKKIKQIIAQYSQHSKTVGVVAHWWTLGFLIATKFRQDSYPQDINSLENAMPFWMTTKKLLEGE